MFGTELMDKKSTDEHDGIRRNFGNLAKTSRV